MLTEEERNFLDKKYGLCHTDGDNGLLSSAMRYIRRSRSVLDSTDAFSVFLNNDMAQIWLQTPACRFSQEGKCTVCNYWAGKKFPKLIQRMEQAISIPKGINTILINTCGSCLDPKELSLREQKRLFQWLNGQPARDIILETHMTTLSEDTVKRVREMVSGKNLFFEIGQESINRDVLFYSLNKPLPKRIRDTVISRIRRYKAKSIVNVMLGAPFLNREERIQDAVHSITGLLQEGADYIMLFPVNIKPNTLVRFLYDMGMYNPVDGSTIAGVLDRIPERILPRVGVAWYGEHREPGVIPPYIPEPDRAEFNKMVAAFNGSDSMEERKQQAGILWDKGKEWAVGYSRETADGCLAERIDKAYQILQKEITDSDRGNGM